MIIDQVGVDRLAAMDRNVSRALTGKRIDALSE